MSARTHRYLPVVVLLALALGLWSVVRTRQTATAQAQLTQEVSVQPAIDRTPALYSALYPEAETVRVEIDGRADGQWLLECQDSASVSRPHFIWDVATGELISCGALRLPSSDQAAWMADHAITDQALRTKRMARRWLAHLGFDYERIERSHLHVEGQFPQSPVRFVSGTLASRKILVGVNTVTGDLKSFYNRPSSPQPPAR